ncbi:MATE family efflux transporter, partial [Enterococcus faecalis]|uniref:MATE family efflux transporter n=1 Tax=Enterococcus faecalis TaxID=1351 RepID=UPI003986F4AF
MLGMAACSSLIFLLFGEFLIRVFTSDPEVVVLAVSLIPPLILYQLGDAMQICYANALRGTSHVMSMMWIAFISYILVNIPAGYILA